MLVRIQPPGTWSVTPRRRPSAGGMNTYVPDDLAPLPEACLQRERREPGGVLERDPNPRSTSAAMVTSNAAGRVIRRSWRDSVSGARQQGQSVRIQRQALHRRAGLQSHVQLGLPTSDHTQMAFACNTAAPSV